LPKAKEKTQNCKWKKSNHIYRLFRDLTDRRVQAVLYKSVFSILAPLYSFQTEHNLYTVNKMMKNIESQKIISF
jgi:hypothetical protein